MSFLDLFRRQKTEHLPAAAKPRPWLGVGEGDMSPEEQAMYEIALNSAMRGGESMVINGPDGITVNGKKYASLEEATAALKGKS